MRKIGLNTICMANSLGIAFGLTMVLLLLAGSTGALPIEEWNKIFGGSFFEEANSVQQTSDGGYVLVGGIVGGVRLTKTFADGTEEWNKTFYTIGTGAGNSGQQTSEGGYILAGGTGAEILLIKTFSNGNEQWNKTFPYGGAGIARSVQQTSDGGYILAGYNPSGARLIKTAADGTEQWNKTFGRPSSFDQFYSVQQTSDGGYVLSGIYTLGGSSDAWLVKTGSDGTEEWNKTFAYGAANSVRQTSDGGYMIAGSQNYSFWLIKTASNGVEQWNKTFTRYYINNAYSGQQTSDGGYILAGYTQSVFGDSDAWLVKTDTNGIEQWNKTFGSTYYDETVKSVQQVSDGSYILAGSTNNYANAWLIKVRDDTTPPSITGNTPTGSSVPVTTKINVTFSEAMNKLSAESAFSTLPGIGGSFGWSNNKMIFTPGSNLAYDTTYSVLISTGAKDLAGNSLQVPYSWDFSTPPSGNITGVVTNAIGGSPIPGALVSLNNGQNNISLVGGTYTINSVPLGSYFITTTATGYAPNITGINVTQGTNIKDIQLQQCRNVFSDVDCSYWGYVYIMILYDHGVTSGYPDGTFKPSNQITRAEVATFIVRAMGLTYTGGLTDFPDVPSTHWAYPFVMAAKQNGIISGYPDGTFKPDNQVSRAEISVMVTRARGWSYSGGLSDFPDVPATHWSYPYVMAVKEKNIVGGYPDGTFKPDNTATRAENSVMIAKMMLWE